jgi:hypothetical protein
MLAGRIVHLDYVTEVGERPADDLPPEPFAYRTFQQNQGAAHDCYIACQRQRLTKSVKRQQGTMRARAS